MSAIYGLQKLGAMWHGSDRAVVLGTWTEALAPYRPKALELAARSLVHRVDEQGQRIQWPPTLPEFIDLVESHHKAIVRAEADAHALAAPKPVPLTPAEIEAQRERVRRMTLENLAWLKAHGVAMPSHIRIEEK